MTDTPKVFGIGFQKTGTGSLGQIFDKLGYKVASYHQFRDLAEAETADWTEITERALRIAKQVDAVKDTPWPLLYRELDAAFPGAKFIHITRQTDAWIKSAVNDFGAYPNGIHKAIYGVPCPKGHEDIWIARYDRHNAEVAAYFRDRPQDYLRLRLEDEFSIERVCDFLGVPPVGAGAPVANTRLRKKLGLFLKRFTGGH